MTQAGGTRPRIVRRRVDGVLLLDKPLGWSSNQALQRVKTFYRAERAGHTGTLDPLATGLLPIALGAATRFAQGLLDADKGYRATLRLGVRTATGDAEGEVLEERTVAVDRAGLEAALARFRGEIEQVPPMYSALKRDGRPLYELARRGETVERAARRVTIHRLALVSFDPPEAVIEVDCSKGTYVRTLAEDIGAALGCGAHLTGLRRTRIGRFDLERARTVASIEAAPEAERDAWLLPPDALLPEMDAATLDAGAAERFCHGQTVAAPGATGGPAAPVRVYAPDGSFLGLAQRTADGRLEPERVVPQLGA